MLQISYLCPMRHVLRPLSALLLGVLFAASTGLKTGHLLLHHHHHRETLPCSARHEQGNPFHLHDERYSAEDCLVCAFWFATPEMPCAGPSLPNYTVVWRLHLPLLEETFQALAPTHRYLRGPPAVLLFL